MKMWMLVVLKVLLYKSLLVHSGPVTEILLCDREFNHSFLVEGSKTVKFEKSSQSIYNIFSYANITITAEAKFNLIFNSAMKNSIRGSWGFMSSDDLTGVINYQRKLPCFEDRSFNISFANSVNKKIWVHVRTIHLDRMSVLLFLTACILFIKARSLSRSVTFLYSSVASVGVLMSVMVVLIILFRIIPYKKPMAFILFTGSGLWCYFLQHMKESIVSVVYNYPYYCGAYVASWALFSVSLLYYFGLPSNDRSLNLLQWSMQLICVYVIYISCYNKQFAVTVITILVCFQFVSFVMIVKYLLLLLLPRRFLAWYYRPKHRRLLTIEEYHQQGIVETANALKELSEFCNSPKCDTWKFVSRLKDPKRFASFLQNKSSQFTAEELESYENDDFVLRNSFEEEEPFDERPLNNPGEQEHEFLMSEVSSSSRGGSWGREWISDDDASMNGSYLH